MRILSYVTATLLLLGATVQSSDQPAVLPDWPVKPTIPDEMPPKPVVPVSALKFDQLYIVQSDEDVQLVSSPPGILTISKETGPIKIRGLFVDGQRVSTRTYSKKSVFIVERIATGEAELLLIPAGKVVRELVKGNDDIPAPKPKPKPVDPTPVKVETFRAIFVYESTDTLTIEQKSVIYGKVVSDYLTAKTTPEGGYAGWRRYDPQMKTDNEQPAMKAFWEKAKPKLGQLPCIVVEVNGGDPIVESLPKTPDEMLKVLKKHRGE